MGEEEEEKPKKEKKEKRDKRGKRDQNAEAMMEKTPSRNKPSEKEEKERRKRERAEKRERKERKMLERHMREMTEMEQTSDIIVAPEEELLIASPEDGKQLKDKKPKKVRMPDELQDSPMPPDMTAELAKQAVKKEKKKEKKAVAKNKLVEELLKGENLNVDLLNLKEDKKEKTVGKEQTMYGSADGGAALNDDMMGALKGRDPRLQSPEKKEKKDKKQKQ